MDRTTRKEIALPSRAYFFAILALLIFIPGISDAKTIGQFSAHQDIGHPGVVGRADYDASSKTYRVRGGGSSIWGQSDQFHFVWRRGQGDISIDANIIFPLASPTPHRKAGIMIRQTLDADSPFVDVMIYGAGFAALQYRAAKGGIVQDIETGISHPKAVRLERIGDYAFMLIAGEDGRLHVAGGPFKLKLAEPYYIGLAVTAHDDKRSETALFSHVSIAQPAATKTVGALESALETINVSGFYDRHVIYQTPGYIESVNWSPDGKAFIFDREGQLYRLPRDGSLPSLIETGPLKKIGDDHGLSPDGKFMAADDASQADGVARLYLLPASGTQTPRLLSGDFPSYFHGWSPDGKWIAFSGRASQATDDQDIYVVSVDGGQPIHLDPSPGMDGGPEFSADGKHIYFNSLRSGNMKIWRMDADGANPSQITFGETRDWFPHPSPDGQWIAFIAYDPNEAIDKHPANKDVMLYLMPASGGAPKVIARLFGGEGTLNVPSWSPDSKQIAIITYRVDPP